MMTRTRVAQVAVLAAVLVTAVGPAPALADSGKPNCAPDAGFGTDGKAYAEDGTELPRCTGVIAKLDVPVPRNAKERREARAKRLQIKRERAACEGRVKRATRSLNSAKAALARAQKRGNQRSVNRATAAVSKARSELNSLPAC